jgi:hypothetical protein
MPVPPMPPCPRLNKTKSTASSGFRVCSLARFSPVNGLVFASRACPKRGVEFFFKKKTAKFRKDPGDAIGVLFVHCLLVAFALVARAPKGPKHIPWLSMGPSIPRTKKEREIQPRSLAFLHSLGRVINQIHHFLLTTPMSRPTIAT